MQPAQVAQGFAAAGDQQQQLAQQQQQQQQTYQQAFGGQQQQQQFAQPMQQQQAITPEVVQQVLALFGGGMMNPALAGMMQMQMQQAAGLGVQFQPMQAAQPQIVRAVQPAGAQWRGGGGGGGDGKSENVLFVRGFTECSDEEVRPLFAPYGATQFDIPRNQEGRPRNFCFVHFPSAEQAAAAVQGMDGKALPNGKTLQVRMKGQR
eukprot:TRINITY_DN280_c2_g1_i4.p1 TRINITY_DN280_c2_g1~~TRINITY_DN280_c2_g1_i4.p1  ORF type:complete len:221 (+),score=102.20 TRINITY_DN280_c2_g1_i4:47-664(+)